MSVPDESLEAITAQAKRERDWRDRASALPPVPPPEDETAAQAFVRRTGEQVEAERRDEALERAVAFANPTAPTAEALADPLRELAREQAARRRRPRRLGG